MIEKNIKHTQAWQPIRKLGNKLSREIRLGRCRGVVEDARGYCRTCGIGPVRRYRATQYQLRTSAQPKAGGWIRSTPCLCVLCLADAAGGR